MRQIRIFATLITSLFAVGTLAQSGQGREASSQGSGQGADQGHGQGKGHEMPSVDDHLKMLSEKLGLTTDQQPQAKAILPEMHDGTRKAWQDESISRDERMARARAEREKAHKKLREILSEDQKKKLDQMEQEPHPDLHGDPHQ